MKLILRSLLCFVLGINVHSSLASDACDGRAIVASAAVEVSDGSDFHIESYFQSAQSSAIRHIQEDIQMIAVEGPLAWISRGDKSQAGGDQLASFALGHQFHAILLHFDEMATDITEVSDISFHGQVSEGLGGNFIYGGKIYLVNGAGHGFPAGIVMKLPEQDPMEISFSDWEARGETKVPLHVRIDDGKMVFDYRYTRIDLTEKEPNWFFNTIAAPDIDQLKIYRLHRRLLTAHCEGDADVIANLTAPEVLISNRGELQQSTRDETRLMFNGLFKHLNYKHYRDISPPVVEVSQGGDMGWIGVNVHVTGEKIDSGKVFDNQWSWVMLAKKIDGVWLNAGNASNLLPTPVP